MMDENMRYYDRGRSVPINAQKAFDTGRFKGTDINPMWRIKKLTELFGPVGFGWYTEVIRQEHVSVDDNSMLVFVDINLYVKEGDTWSKPIFGTGGNTIRWKGKGDDEGYKKAYTDALGIACKALGIGADIWYSADANSDANCDPTSKYSDRYTPTERAADDKVEAAKSNPLNIVTENTPVCERCGKVITGWVDENGRTFNATAIIKRAKERYGGCFCAKCMSEIAESNKKKRAG